MSHSTSIVPIVLWGKSPPTHSISVVTCTYDQKTVISGTSDGQIGLWDLRLTNDSTLKLIPRNLIFAHGSAVVDIACALDANFEKPNIVSLSSDGELCLWDIEDGLCIQTNNISGTHKHIQSVQVSKGSFREWRLLLYGLYCDIYVLDTASLEIIYTLKSRLTPDWINCLCTLRNARHQEEKLVALTSSNVLKVWRLKASYEKRRPEVVYEQESKNMDCLKAKGMCCNPFTQRTILVISSKAWQIFDSNDYSFLALIPSPYKQALIGGDFVAANRVLIWDKVDRKAEEAISKLFAESMRILFENYLEICKIMFPIVGGKRLILDSSGRAYLYRLPSRYLLGAEGMEQTTPDKSSRTPVLICLFDLNNLKVNFGAPMHFSYGRRGPFFKLLLQGTSSGSIHIWKVPDSEQADESLAIGQTSATELVNSEATVLNQGIRMTVMIDEGWTMKLIPTKVTMSLKELWKESKPRGLIDGITYESNQAVSITSSLYLSSQGLIVCGRKDGLIVVINAVKAALNQLLEANDITKTDHQPLNVLKGHSGKVTCLLYPNEENPRYDVTHLISGGADFTVRLWDVFSGTLLHSFNSHGGEVVKLVVTPSDCTARFLSCICSVAQDHSVALLAIRERKILLLASRHTFPVETIRWRAKDDFMVVGCADGTVYVWQMETGHLDRCVAGSVAYDILESCCEETSSPTAAVREYRHKFRLQTSLSAVRQQLPLEFNTPTIVKKVKKKISHIQHQVSPNQKSSSPQQEPRQPPPQPQLSPIRVCALRSNRNDSDIHVLLLDPEALICQLLAEDAEAASSHGKPVNPKRHPARGLSQIANQDQHKFAKTQIQKELSHEMAQLILSCVHSWGIDPNLDETCISRLGMLRPLSSISFGLLTRGRLSLMLPNWKISSYEDVTSSDPDETDSKGNHFADPVNHQKLQFNSHWQLSSSLTTQHLIGIVSITNTLMSMNHVSFVNQVKSQSGGFDDNFSMEQIQISQQRAEEKAGWSLVAALHCCLLPEMMRGFMYRPPLLHILARRWQDRCLEIREAAQAILLAELRRVGVKGRKQLIDAWSPHLPQDFDSTDFGFEDLEQYLNNEDDKATLITAEEDKPDVAMVMLTTRKMVSSDVRLRHATAIVMMGVIGAEFQKEVDPLALPRDTRGQLSEGVMEVTTLRNTAKALTSLLLQRPTSKAPAYSAIRRAAIDLIGRGFALWEPHIDVSHVLIGLLDLCANTNLPVQEYEYGNSILSAPADLHRSARHALALIATARPAAFITTLAKEVARHVANASSISFNQTSPAAIAVYSHVRHQPTPSTPDSQNSNIIHSARNEILRTIELMIEKNQHDVVHLIVEVADIVVHCLDHKAVKDKGLCEVFPAICRFSMVSYCSNTRRLAVGSRIGHIALYELRSSRCQLIPAHTSSITALAFSNEGKILASFSFEEAKISFWQTSSSLLGILSSTVKCVQSHKTTELKKCSSASIKRLRLIWVNNKSIVILTGDNKEFKFSI